ncbi:MAG: PLP-dependent aminotransferase family protein [Coriobacteriia bacterium]|nr:PLP-dependent aminotransferase family protein [Coriobacteriia bacterium]
MDQSLSQAKPWEGQFAERIKTMRHSATRDLFGAAARDDMISFSGGMPDVRVMPEDVLRVALEGTIADKGEALQYGSTDGREKTKKIVVELMKELGVEHICPDDLIITSGAQQALDLIAKVFINPGDTILVEAPTYLGALQAFSSYQPNFKSVPFDDNGIRVDLLEEVLKEIGPRGAKFLYTIPTFQNPGGVTMALERRKRLIELCREYEITIIEDDPYSRLRYAGEHIPCLRSMDENVVYLGTFSKIFAPGLRLGWVLAPQDILGRINLAKQGADLCGSAFTQIVAEHYFEETDWKATLRDFIATYGSRREAMLEACEEYLPKEVHFTKPEGGFFLWLTLPEYINTDDMLQEALDRGVTFVPGSGCFADYQHNSMRLAFCYEKEEDIKEGIRRLAKIIAEHLESDKPQD